MTDPRALVELLPCPFCDGEAFDGFDEPGEWFAFYAREHSAAGKHEKAATNQRFAEMAAHVLARAALASPGDGGRGG